MSSARRSKRKRVCVFMGRSPGNIAGVIGGHPAGAEVSVALRWGLRSPRSFFGPARSVFRGVFEKRVPAAARAPGGKGTAIACDEGPGRRQAPPLGEKPRWTHRTASSSPASPRTTTSGRRWSRVGRRKALLIRERPRRARVRSPPDGTAPSLICNWRSGTVGRPPRRSCGAVAPCGRRRRRSRRAAGWPRRRSGFSMRIATGWFWDTCGW